MEKKFVIELESGEKLNGISFLVDNAKANFTIITGMCEYARRYAPFAKKLNEAGINVFALDALGQGANVDKVEDLQIWPKDGFKKNVDAVAKMIEMAKENGLKTIHFGHSMGSFISQSLLERYPLICDGVILCGSNGGQKMLMEMGFLLAKLVKTKKNYYKPNKFITGLSLGGYSKAIKDRRTDLDWLSYNEENVDNYIADPYCGVPNTLSFWIEFLRGMKEIWKHKNLRKISVNEKILLVAGEDDPVGRCGKGVKWLDNKYKSLGIINTRMILYPHMRHEILNEKDNKKVIEDILNFVL